MRVRILIAAAVVSSGWLGACSKPAPDTASTAATAPDGRHILLPETPRPDGAVVSDLEASRAAQAVRKSREPLPSVALTRGHRALPAVAAPSIAHEMVMTTSSVAPSLRPVDLAPVPLAAAIPVVPASEGHFLPGNDGDYPLRGMGGGLGGGTRGPAIIIRGGMGSPDDDCDILNMRGHRGGMAVNRSAPAFGGSGGGSRGGGYPRGIR